jgi:hypothetical protein
MGKRSCGLQPRIREVDENILEKSYHILLLECCAVLELCSL